MNANVKFNKQLHKSKVTEEKYSYKVAPLYYKKFLFCSTIYKPHVVGVTLLQNVFILLLYLCSYMFLFLLFYYL